MQPDFMVNQTVSAADLNNIAVDLGDAEFSHFPETAPQSAVSALNSITADLVTAGIIYDDNACNVSLSSDETKVYVGKGIIVFSNGAKIRITEQQTFDISFINTGDTYKLYASYNEDANIAALNISETYPVSGEYVKIAEIKKIGGIGVSITQNRTFCTPKALNFVTSYKAYDINKSFTSDGGIMLTIPKELWNNANMFAYELNIDDKYSGDVLAIDTFVLTKSITFVSSSNSGTKIRFRDKPYSRLIMYFKVNAEDNIDVMVYSTGSTGISLTGKAYII